MAATHIVTKPFAAAGGELPAGAQVDASTWRNTATLVRARFLRPITEADIAPEPEPAAPTRRQRGREVQQHAE